jgi:hypothetical protein
MTVQYSKGRRLACRPPQLGVRVWGLLPARSLLSAGTRDRVLGRPLDRSRRRAVGPVLVVLAIVFLRDSREISNEGDG